MLISTTESVPDHRVVVTLGLVRGNTIRTRHIGADIAAALRNLVGGELPEYTRLMAGAREQALDRMTEEAEALGADAVIGMRFAISALKNATEILAYGTAVRLAPASASSSSAQP